MPINGDSAIRFPLDLSSHLWRRLKKSCWMMVSFEFFRYLHNEVVFNCPRRVPGPPNHLGQGPGKVRLMKRTWKGCKKTWHWKNLAKSDAWPVTLGVLFLFWCFFASKNLDAFQIPRHPRNHDFAIDTISTPSKPYHLATGSSTFRAWLVSKSQPAPRGTGLGG